MSDTSKRNIILAALVALALIAAVVWFTFPADTPPTANPQTTTIKETSVPATPHGEKEPRGDKGKRDAQGELDHEVDRQLADQLAGLGYAERVPAKNTDKVGVTRYDAGAAWPGLNLYAVINASAAVLLDMDGKEVHRWEDKDPKTKRRRWKLTKLLPNGDLLALASRHHMSRYSWSGERLWTTAGEFHHDFNLTPEGEIVVLTYGKIPLIYDGVELPVKDNGLAFLSPEDGRVLRHISLQPMLRQFISPKTFRRLRNKAREQTADTRPQKQSDSVFHCNSVQYVSRDIKGVCDKGTYLISSRNLDRIICLDLKTQKVVWNWGPGTVEKQHHPTILANNNILLFDNGSHRKWSRIIELKPATEEIVWEYKAPDFFSHARGSVQKLGNGNVLITESAEGRIFEVTPSGDVVWEFFEPDISGDKRRAIYRMLRYSPEFIQKASAKPPTP